MAPFLLESGVVDVHSPHSNHANQAQPLTALMLTGGGARAAYQMGVLRAISAMRRIQPGYNPRNPFEIVVGTSAGAINASALACCADRFDDAVEEITSLWSDIRAEDVFRSDSLGVIRAGAKWLTLLSMGWLVARWRRARPRSLLDNAPLGELLKRTVPFDRLPRMLAEGHLHALAISASGYTSGQHVTFYQAARDIEPWARSSRIAVRDQITAAHVLASSAIPFVFPSVGLPMEGAIEWFGDGSMRQSAPISPAIHLGAERVLVIGAGRMHEPPGPRRVADGYPSLAQIAGHAMSNIFLDSLAVDIERMQRINATLALLPREARAHTALRPVDILVIAPSQRIDDIAAKHQRSLPLPIRTMLRGLGVSGEGDSAKGAALASYLLFESDYTRELIALGEADTWERLDDLTRFFGWEDPDAVRHEQLPDAQAALVSAA